MKVKFLFQALSFKPKFVIIYILLKSFETKFQIEYFSEGIIFDTNLHLVKDYCKHGPQHGFINFFPVPKVRLIFTTWPLFFPFYTLLSFTLKLLLDGLMTYDNHWSQCLGILNLECLYNYGIAIIRGFTLYLNYLYSVRLLVLPLIQKLH